MLYVLGYAKIKYLTFDFDSQYVINNAFFFLRPSFCLFNFFPLSYISLSLPLSLFLSRHSLSLSPPLSPSLPFSPSLSPPQCILITCMDTRLRPFESDMPNLWRAALSARGVSSRSPPPLCVQPHLSPFTSHLSPSGHVQYRVQTLTSRSLLDLLSALGGRSARSRGCEGGFSDLGLSPSLTPVLPVALLL